MIRHQHLCAFGNQNLRRRQALFFNGSQLFEEKFDIQRNARAKHVDHIRRTHTAGQKMERKAAIIVDDGMTGVRTALKANHNIGFRRKHIGNLTLALVAPVRTDNRAYHGRFNPFHKAEAAKAAK